MTAGWWAYGAGKNSVVAAAARVEVREVERIRTVTRRVVAAQNRAASTTQALQQEVSSDPIYRECNSSADAVRLFNAGIPEQGAERDPGTRELPGQNADP